MCQSVTARCARLDLPFASLSLPGVTVWEIELNQGAGETNQKGRHTKRAFEVKYLGWPRHSKGKKGHAGLMTLDVTRQGMNIDHSP